MAADIEWVVGVLRVGGNFEGHGDPYEFSCTINVRGDEAELIGGCGEITPQMGRDIRTALLTQGITKARWIRADSGARGIAVEAPDDCRFPLGPCDLVLGSQANN